MLHSFGLFWKNIFNFSGRTTRRDYWLATLGLYIGCVIMVVIFLLVSMFFGENDVILTLLFALVMFIYLLAASIATISMQVRRFHDIGKSGWWFIGCIVANFVCVSLGILPIGGILSFALSVQDSGPDNCWGRNPKAPNFAYGYSSQAGYSPQTHHNPYNNQNGYNGGYNLNGYPQGQDPQNRYYEGNSQGNIPGQGYRNNNSGFFNSQG